MDNGKAPVAENGEHRNGVAAGHNVINVQPPRREDLQPAYAQTLQGESEDAATHGWYGSMSMESQAGAACATADNTQSIRSVH